LPQRPDKGSVLPFWMKSGLLSDQVKLIWDKTEFFVLSKIGRGLPNKAIFSGIMTGK
jgi:hypothetical protein